MLPANTRLVSVDDHIHEHRRVWLDRLPARYHEVGPRVVELADGREAWRYEEQTVPINDGTSIPRPGLPPNRKPVRFDEMRPGCYDPKARLADMDEDRVWAQIGFPQWARFAGHRFFPTDDPELSRLCVNAYNDFILDEWCAACPERLFPMAIIPWWDIPSAITEVRRMAAAGAKAIAFSENPTILGMPSVHTDHWDPLWAVISEVELPICMHIGSSSRVITSSPDAPAMVTFAVTGVNAMLTFADWISCGVFDRFPRLRIVLSEGGAGWVPYALERMENFPEIHAQHFGYVASKRRPTEIYQEHVSVCIVNDRVALDLVQKIGEDNLMWESDYPHGDGLWPNSRNALETAMRDVPDTTAIKVASLNACRVFNLDLPGQEGMSPCN